MDVVSSPCGVQSPLENLESQAFVRVQVRAPGASAAPPRTPGREEPKPKASVDLSQGRIIGNKKEEPLKNEQESSEKYDTILKIYL